MEKYARVLVIIFFLCLINLGFNLYILSIVTKPVAITTVPNLQPATRNSPQAVPTVATTPPNIQSDLTLIKAEIRALREALDITGLIETTPTP